MYNVVGRIENITSYINASTSVAKNEKYNNRKENVPNF